MSYLPSDRTVVLAGTVNSTMFAEFCAAMHALEQQDANAPIAIELNSEGGDTHDALAIAGRLRASPCPTICIGYGRIMSAATLIFAAGTTRVMSRYAWFMIHDATEHFEGSIGTVRPALKQLEREEHQWIELMEQFTGVPKALWAELTAKSAFLSAEECKNLTIIDELL